MLRKTSLLASLAGVALAAGSATAGIAGFGHAVSDLPPMRRTGRTLTAKRAKARAASKRARKARRITRRFG